MLNTLRSAVSADRRRFKDADFDLDLSYVTPRIIAMAMPSAGLTSAYRNHMDDVNAFLRSYHGENFMIWNLSENSYDSKFSDKVIHLPFPDHHPPPLDLYLKIVEMMDNWLRADENHVAVVHCKGGKGRTGTIIVSLLFFRGECATILEAEKLFAKMRSTESKGVTQPSQRRYIQYFKTILLEDRLINYQPIRLKNITVAPLTIGKPLLLQIFSGVTDDARLLYAEMQDQSVEIDQRTCYVKFNIELDVRGDLYFKFLRKKDKDTVERGFHVVLHSYFIANTQFLLARKDLDHLKPSDKRFSNDLTVTFRFGPPESKTTFPDTDDLHHRMACKFHANDAPQNSKATQSSSNLVTGSVNKRKAQRKYRIAPNGDKSEGGSPIVFDHPLLRQSVKLSSSIGNTVTSTLTSKVPTEYVDPSILSNPGLLSRQTSRPIPSSSNAQATSSSTSNISRPPQISITSEEKPSQSVTAPSNNQETRERQSLQIRTLGEFRKSRKISVGTTALTNSPQVEQKSWHMATPNGRARGAQPATSQPPPPSAPHTEDYSSDSLSDGEDYDVTLIETDSGSEGDL